MGQIFLHAKERINCNKRTKLILSCGEFLHLTICHVDKILYMTELLVPVKNMRYAPLLLLPPLSVHPQPTAISACLKICTAVGNQN